jgi:endoglucanase
MSIRFSPAAMTSPQSRSGTTGRGLRWCAALLLLGGCKDAVAPKPGTDYSCETPGFVTSNGEKIPVAPNGFATVGNQIIDAATCTPFRFVGVSRPSLAFTPGGDRLGSDTAAAADFARIRAWKANTVRIELAQYFWLNTSRYYDPGYVARVDRAVAAARSAGLHVILALHHSDRGDPAYPADALTTNMHQPMADRRHSIPFWRDVASRYKGDGKILFELYGEPFPLGGPGGFSNWDLWLKGGQHPADDVYEPRKPFEAAGMQELYDAVRSTGANNMVIASGTNWGYYLNGVPTHKINGYNVAYTSHPWSYEGQRAPATWEQDWAFLAQTHPVMVTEFGNYDCTLDYPRAVLNKADQLGLSWVAWAWQAPTTSKGQKDGDPICEFPMLLTDWNGSPSGLGQLVKDRLASY